MAQLQRLIISNNNLTQLPVGRVPHTIKHLDISCLRLKELSTDSFKPLQTLKELHIRGCEQQVSRLEKSILMLVHKRIRIRQQIHHYSKELVRKQSCNFATNSWTELKKGLHLHITLPFDLKQCLVCNQCLCTNSTLYICNDGSVGYYLFRSQ